VISTDLNTKRPLAVEAKSIVKNYDEEAVLRNVNISLPPGEVTVLFGSNGAGKSTLIRILAMLTRADSGRVSIYGLDIAENGPLVRGLTGSALHYPMLYNDMTVRENLEFFAGLYRLTSIDDLVNRVANQVGIRPRLDDRVRELSHGFQKRVSIARSLLHEPQLLLLDEPESGLDAQSVARLDCIIAGYKKSGRSVFMTTHVLDHGLEIADRALVLAGGVIGFESLNPYQDKSEINEAVTPSEQLEEVS
jgi:heme exporter protein A